MIDPRTTAKTTGPLTPHHAGIATFYRGTQFRSRIEAIWAAFFDKCDWPWEYEPVDLLGYIPDFILTFPHEPVLVEVKSCMTVEELGTYSKKVTDSGWRGDFLIVGGRLFEDTVYQRPSIGLLYQASPGPDGDDGPPWQSDALLHVCGKCKSVSFHHADGGWHCASCGVSDGRKPLSFIDEEWVLKAWRDARNLVQWKKPAGAI